MHRHWQRVTLPRLFDLWLDCTSISLDVHLRSHLGSDEDFSRLHPPLLSSRAGCIAVSSPTPELLPGQASSDDSLMTLYTKYICTMLAICPCSAMQPRNPIKFISSPPPTGKVVHELKNPRASYWQPIGHNRTPDQSDWTLVHDFSAAKGTLRI